MLRIDGSYQEGGGQILRTALGLSLVTQTPFRIEKIRAGRKKPGLLRQHLTSVNAAAEISRAQVKGNTIGSQELEFIPGMIIPGKYDFSVGTAGSTTLVLQTVLPALLMASNPSFLTLEGGTHNLAAPPYDFIEKTFLPLLRRMGARVSVKLERPGFYPAGGGKLTVRIDPPGPLTPLELPKRGKIIRTCARALISNLPKNIAKRELSVIERELSFPKECLKIEEVEYSGPGNIILIEMESEEITEVFSAFGERRIPAEKVAIQAVQQVRHYLDAGVPVGKHLADQLLVPLAIMRGGAFSTMPLTLHTQTNMDIIKKFLSINIRVSITGKNFSIIEVRQ